MRYMNVLISLLLVFLFVGCGTQEGGIEEKTYKDGDKIELTSVVGSKYTLLRQNGGFVVEGHEDKIVMLDIFGTFCPPCQKEAAHLMDLQIKNVEDFILIGFNSFETVSNEYVVENFSKKYNAYYFIVNSKENDKMIETILQDIDYKKTLQIPFKVVLKNGKYEKLKDVYEDNPENNFYIGDVPTDIMQKDIDRIKKQ